MRLSGGQKIRGWRIGALKHDLAQGKTQTELARMYGCTQSSISEFASRHKAEIEEIKANATALLQSLWIADKEKRIAGYQETAERVDAVLDAERERSEDGRGKTTGGVPLAELLRTQQAAYRAVAEELGDLPQRIKIEGGGEPVKHVIEGVDLGDLT